MNAFPGLKVLAAVLSLVPPCPFHALTGLQCPGCGGTHCFLALVQGDFAAAWHDNALLALLLPAAALLVCLHLVANARHRPSLAARLLRMPSALWILSAATILFGIGRNLT